MRQIRKFKKVPAAAVIDKLRNEFFRKEWENPLEENFSEARQEFLKSNWIAKSWKPGIKKIKPAQIIAHTKKLGLILDHLETGIDRDLDRSKKSEKALNNSEGIQFVKEPEVNP